MYRLNIRREMPDVLEFREEEHRHSRNPKFCANLVVGNSGLQEFISVKFEDKKEFDAFIAGVVKATNDHYSCRRNEEQKDAYNELYNNLFTAKGLLSKSAATPSTQSEVQRIYEVSVYKDVNGRKYGVRA